MVNIFIKDLIAAMNDAKLLCGNLEVQIHSLCIDSRAVFEGCLFIPIIGEKVDAHKFIPQVIEAGATAILTSEHDHADPSWLEVNPNLIVIAVKDTIDALHEIGVLCRSRVLDELPAVGVTGSVGKTTTREMIAHAMSVDKEIFKTNKNYNSSIGVPITMSLMDPACDYAVLELGMNVPGELGMISKIAQVKIGVITNIGVAHIEYYDTQDRIALEKLTIAHGMDENGILVLNGDDPYLKKYGPTEGHPYLFYGLDPENDIYGEDISIEDGSMSFTVRIKKGGKLDLAQYEKARKDCDGIRITLTLPGRHNILNALATMAVCILTGTDIIKAADSLKTFKGFMNRLQVINLPDHITLIDDTYNASPTSMKAGIDVLCDMKCDHARIAVLGSMFELGKNSPLYHYEVGEFAAKSKINTMITVGEEATNIASAISEHNENQIFVYALSDIDEAAKVIVELAKPGDVIYFKASNGMHFKNLVAMVSDKLAK